MKIEVNDAGGWQVIVVYVPEGGKVFVDGKPLGATDDQLKLQRNRAIDARNSARFLVRQIMDLLRPFAGNEIVDSIEATIAEWDKEEAIATIRRQPYEVSR